MKTKFKQIELPAYWASALVNGDYSGLDDDTLLDVHAWQRVNPNVNVVSCSDNVYIGRYDGLICDMLTYTVEVNE